jgi:hypothetical protein
MWLKIGTLLSGMFFAFVHNYSTSIRNASAKWSEPGWFLFLHEFPAIFRFDGDRIIGTQYIFSRAWWTYFCLVPRSSTENRLYSFLSVCVGSCSSWQVVTGGHPLVPHRSGHRAGRSTSDPSWYQMEEEVRTNLFFGNLRNFLKSVFHSRIEGLLRNLGDVLELRTLSRITRDVPNIQDVPENPS